MFGIETFEVLAFLRQVGLAASGAAAFWGFVFMVFSGRTSDKRSSALWQGISQKLILVLFPALVLYGAAWLGIAIALCVFCLDAHEGISIAETARSAAEAAYRQYGLYATLMAVGLAGFILRAARPQFFYGRLSWFYAILISLISALLLFPWAGQESFRENLSLSLHNWHSIFTLGSVIVVDFLFVALKFNLRPYLTKIFPIISGGIWAGLGLDFLNSGLVWEQFSPVARILFMQTLVGVIIINGALLAGPIARAIISYQARMKAYSLPRGLSQIVGLSGAISISGWLGITALDGFRSLTLAYWQIGAIYLAFVICVYLLRRAAEDLAARYAGN